jgi:hypothetical protein
MSSLLAARHSLHPRAQPKGRMPALAPAPGLRLGRRGAKGASAAGQGSNLPIWETRACFEEIASAKNASQ